MASIGLHRMTVREVQAARSGKHDDGGGLQLKVGDDGRATWVYRFTAPSGRRREMGLGVAIRDNPKATGASLTAARDAADAARKLLRAGVDPIADRERQREAAQAAEAARKAARQADHWTLARCARDFHARVIEPSRSPKHAAQWLSSLENHVPPTIWHARIDDIEPAALLRALTSIKPHERARNMTEDRRLGETVRRIAQRVDAACEDAVFHRRATTNPAQAIKRKLREAMPRKAKRNFRAMPFAELPAFVARLRSAEGIAARCLEFLILTGARTSEALLCEWTEVDLDAGLWVIPAAKMKAREPHSVFLSERALAILKAQRGQSPRWVFPSAVLKEGESRPLSNMALLAVLDRLGVRDRATVHGFRAALSTWANEGAHARPDVVEAALAHREADKVRAAYSRAQFADERRDLLRKWADYLKGAEVIEFPQRVAS